jgi:lactoylglutathione lyase
MSVDARANVKQAVPFFGVSKIDESLRYYVDGLGFQVTHKWIDEGKLRWCWLEHGGAAVMLQEFWDDGRHDPPPTGKLGQGASVYFICENALAFYREVTSRGIRASKPFVGNGMWVTSLSDPDGYNLHFESLTNAPEETEYSGQEG